MRRGRVCLVAGCAALIGWGAPPAEIADDLKQGQWLQSQGRFDEARQQFRKTLSEASATPALPYLQAVALSNLASVETDRGRPESAAGLYNRAIGILQNSAGDYAAAIAGVRIRLAELYLANGEIVTAEKLIRSVIAGRSASGPDAATALDVLACIYAYRKKFREAETAGREALAILDLAGRQNKPEYAIATLHLGSFLNNQKRPADAAPVLQSALAMLRRLPVPQPAVEGSAEITLASVYSFLGRGEEALKAAEDARRTTENFFGPIHPATAATLLAEAAVLRRIGQKGAAHRAQLEGERILAAKTGRGISATVPLESLLPDNQRGP